MDEHTQAAKAWLDKRFSRDRDGLYFAHQPIYGYESNHSEPNAILRLARTYRLLRIFESLRFDSFLDVGGSEGHSTALVRDLFDVTAHNLDLSLEACIRAREIFDIQSAASDAARLPFLDDSYDLVLCSEVIEHLSRPVLVISELVRVARRYVVITTDEFCTLGELERVFRLCLLDLPHPHAERNCFTRRDFYKLFGDEVFLCSQMRNLGGRVGEFFANLELTRTQVEKSLEFLTSTSSIDVDHGGVVVIAPQNKASLDHSIANIGVIGETRRRQILNRLLMSYPETAKPVTDDATLDLALVRRLVCLACRGKLDLVGMQLVCSECGQKYQVRDGIPLMFLESIPPTLSAADSNARAVALLSRGNDERAHRIRLLAEKLHGKRPICSDSLRAVSRMVLRILRFLRRPESFGAKVKRVIRRLRNDAPVDYDLIKEALFFE